MQVDSTAIAVPTEPGTPFEGGFYAGRFRIGEQLFALIVAPKAAGELTECAWLPEYRDVPGATSCCDGLANTEAMAAAGSTTAQGARALDIGGFSDWYVPSRDELELLYRNLKPTTEENACSFRDGDNPSSAPTGYPYAEASPAQTSAQAFQAGGSEAFEAAWYWSSTQYSRGYAWGQGFGLGLQLSGGKSWAGGRARAVRRFSL